MLITLIVSFAVACRGEPATNPAAIVEPLDRWMSWGRTVQLEESPTVINVAPRVAYDGAGAFLVGDGQEEQVRLYAPDGRLRKAFGRRGQGPGEFGHISAAARLRDGRILVADMNGTLAYFDSTGTRLAGTARTEVEPLYEVHVLDDSLLALTGRRGAPAEGALIHVWNTRTNRLLRSFFHPVAPDPSLKPVYVFGGITTASVRGDTVAALFALKDTVFLFGIDGGPRGRVPFGATTFRRATEPMPDDARGPAAFTRWAETFSTAAGVYWLSDGSFLVQFFDRRGAEPRWRLLHIFRDGRPPREVVDAPHLLALAAGDTLVFVKPGSDTPNAWALARLSAH